MYAARQSASEKAIREAGKGFDGTSPAIDSRDVATAGNADHEDHDATAKCEASACREGSKNRGRGEGWWTMFRITPCPQ